MAWNKFIGITMLLYGLTNPIGIIPIFMELTQRVEQNRAHRIILVASAAVAGFLIVPAMFGEQILAFFNVGLDDFRIAGGLLALFIAFEMFQARYGGFMQTLDEKTEAETDIHGVAITPLAFPLLVGPAEMSIMITMSNDLHRWTDKAMLMAAAVVATLLMGLTLWMATPISRVMSKTGINVATRVMALVVAAIGINFIMTGLKNELPGLLR
jgi:multiple antibiotic resistance protein